MDKTVRTYGQDLMCGEWQGNPKAGGPHPGGGGCWLNKPDPGLIWVGGERSYGELDEVSRKILAASSSGTSIFDPVLTEILLKWFCPAGGHVLDPFAGGSVRGIVASVLGYQYTGVELRAEQVAQCEAQRGLCRDPQPVWHTGDSANIAEICAGLRADFILSCPPYADLETYSDDMRDISNMRYDDFILSYRQIIAASCSLLTADSFACFVVGDARDKQGCYYGIPEDTVTAFRAAGLRKYNEIILVTAAGSLPIRAGKQFRAGRKVGKTHQNVLVFVKGDPKKAARKVQGDLL